MAISYSNEASECTEAEIKNKPKDEQKILNDDDATQAAEKKQENANPNKNEKPDPSGSVSESVEDEVGFEDLDEGVGAVVGISSAAAAVISAIGAFAINKAKHKGATATKKTINYVTIGMDKLRTKQLKAIENILKSSKTFSVKPADFEFSKNYVAANKGNIAEVKKLLDEVRSKYVVTTDDAKMAVSANYTADELKEMTEDTRNIREYCDKLTEISRKLDSAKPPKKQYKDKMENAGQPVSKDKLLSVYREIEKEISDGAESARNYLKAFDVANYSEVVETGSSGSNTYSFDVSRGISLSSSTRTQTEVRKSPNSVFVGKANALAEVYNIANACYQCYVQHALYYLKTSSNTLMSEKTIREDALPEEKLAMAKALVEEVQIESEIMTLVNEAAEELCLDEEYVKNEVRKDAIIKGKLMKEAKAHAKAAKTAIKKMDTETAISEQEQYVAALKKLYEECSNIKDDSKMIIVSSAVISGLLASTGALLVGAELTVFHGMAKHGGMKTDGAILDVKSEKDQELAYNALSKHFGSKTGKIEIAATAVVSIVSGIIAGVLKYKKGMLKYGVKNEKTHKLEVAKSRIEAQQRLRRMVRLAEQILNEYKSIQKIESDK